MVGVRQVHEECRGGGGGQGGGARWGARLMKGRGVVKAPCVYTLEHSFGYKQRGKEPIECPTLCGLEVIKVFTNLVTAHHPNTQPQTSTYAQRKSAFFMPPTLVARPNHINILNSTCPSSKAPNERLAHPIQHQ